MSLLFIKLLVLSQKGVTCEAAVHFSTPVCETARRKMVCTEHKNYSSTNVSHVCPHLKAMHSITSSWIEADDNIDDDHSFVEFADDQGVVLCGVCPPISNQHRQLLLAPRKQSQSFNQQNTCLSPSQQICNTCVAAGRDGVDTFESVVDGPGVVLFDSGEQIPVEVQKLLCQTCSAEVPYEGNEDNLVVMERGKSIAGTPIIIILDGHWLAGLARKVYSSKDSFSDIYNNLERCRRLLQSGGEEQSVVQISKTKFCKYIWQYLTYLILPNVPEDALSCKQPTCGRVPRVLVLDAVSIGLLKTNVGRKFHTVPEKQLRFPRVSCT